MYSGHYSDQLKSILAENNNEIKPKIVDVEGNTVISDVSIALEKGDIVLRLDGIEYNSLSDALVELESKYATHFATGSNTAGGNAANNIIGNHDIFGHTMLNGVSLKEIMGVDVILEKRRVSKQTFQTKLADSAIEKAYNVKIHCLPEKDMLIVLREMETLFAEGIGYTNAAKKILETRLR